MKQRILLVLTCGLMLFGCGGKGGDGSVDDHSKLSADDQGDRTRTCHDVDSEARCLDGDHVPPGDIPEDRCIPGPIDDDGDGISEGIDLDCDGEVDVPNHDDDHDPDCVPGPIDDDGDGISEGVDLDCDGVADTHPGDDDEDGCHPAPIDDDGNGIPDGIDLDCDGEVDVELHGPGGNHCVPELIDNDGDGHPDCVDLSCFGGEDICW